MPVSSVTVSVEFQSQRLDNFLKNHLKGVPMSCIYRFIRTGQVRVNKKRAKPSYHLASGDVIRIPPVKLEPEETKKKLPPALIQRFKQAILYENDQVLVINKPAGFAVHGGSGLSFGVIEIMRQLYGEHEDIGLVHRLDRETSGCLVLARKRSVLRDLHEQLRLGKVDKTYFALIKGVETKKRRKVELSLHKNQLLSGERMVRVQEDGKQAATTFIPVDFFGDSTLVEVIPHTGRTHQIRVHAQAIGQPVAGDEKYGDKVFNKKIRLKGLKRLFLHASQIIFSLPGQEKKIKVTAPLPEELEVFLKCLSK